MYIIFCTHVMLTKTLRILFSLIIRKKIIFKYDSKSLFNEIWT